MFWILDLEFGFQIGEQVSFKTGKSSAKIWGWTQGLSDQSLGNELYKRVVNICEWLTFAEIYTYIQISGLI